MLCHVKIDCNSSQQGKQIFCFTPEKMEIFVFSVCSVGLRKSNPRSNWNNGTRPPYLVVLSPCLLTYTQRLQALLLVSCKINEMQSIFNGLVLKAMPSSIVSRTPALQSASHRILGRRRKKNPQMQPPYSLPGMKFAASCLTAVPKDRGNLPPCLNCF